MQWCLTSVSGWVILVSSSFKQEPDNFDVAMSCRNTQWRDLPKVIEGVFWSTGFNQALNCRKVAAAGNGVRPSSSLLLESLGALEQLFKANCIIVPCCNHQLFVFCHIWWAEFQDHQLNL